MASYKLHLLMGILLTLLFTLTLPVNCNGQSSFDYQKAYKLYMEVIRGDKKFENLTPNEKEEVIVIHRIAKSGYSDDSSEECREAREEAESAASDLENAARRLANCAASQDYDDDCSSEYYRVRSAYDDYESAVSDVSSYCD